MFAILQLRDTCDTYLLFEISNKAYSNFFKEKKKKKKDFNAKPQYSFLIVSSHFVFLGVILYNIFEVQASCTFALNHWKSTTVHILGEPNIQCSRKKQQQEANSTFTRLQDILKS